MSTVVGIRFRAVGKVYYYDADCCPAVGVGEFVIAPSRRGTQIGEVVKLVPDPPDPPEGGWRSIIRKATGRDLTLRRLLRRRELEALLFARQKARELGYEGLKVVEAEISLDERFLTVLYGAEGSTKTDVRPLHQFIARKFPRKQVEFRRLGPRDVARLLPGMGACGMEERCCARFLTDFAPVSIKMAKVQGVSLTPSEITGVCGRLRCCLVYEYEQYAEAAKTLPKRKKRVMTPRGEGKVVDLYPLKQTVLVLLDEGGVQEFHRDELEPWNEAEARRRAEAVSAD